MLIEPCCTQKHIPALLRQLDERSTVAFEGYGDLILSDLLVVLGDMHIGQELTIVTPTMPRYLISHLRHMLAATVVHKGRNSHRHPHLTIITDANDVHSPGLRALVESAGDRITLHQSIQSDTMIILPDELWFGNIGRGLHFHGIVTRDKVLIQELTSNIYPPPAKSKSRQTMFNI